MAGTEFDKVSLKFNFKSGINALGKYTVDLIQRDENGKIIGGETFIVEPPVASNRQLSITSTSSEDGKTALSVDAGPEESVRWETEDGTVVGQGNTVEVQATPNTEKIYYVYVLSGDGELASEQIGLNSESGIEKAVMDSRTDVLNVYLKERNACGSSIVVSSVLTGETVLRRDLDEEAGSIEFDMSSLTPGIYAVAYVFNGEVIDSVKISK